MNKVKWGGRLLIANFIFFLLYNAYYGWNTEPINDTEKILDIIQGIWLMIAVIIYLNPLFGLYEDAIQRFEIRKILNASAVEQACDECESKDTCPQYQKEKNCSE